MKDLRHVQSDQVLRKFAKIFANGMQRPVLTILKYDEERLGRFDKALVLDNIWVVKVLQQVYFQHYSVKLIFWKICQLHLLDRDGFARAPVQGSVYRSERTLPQTIS